MDKVYLGKRIRKLRLENNLSQQRLAELSDVTLAYISNIEHGKHMPTIEVLIRLMNALNINYSVLMDESKEDSLVKASILANVQNASENELNLFESILENLKE